MFYPSPQKNEVAIYDVNQNPIIAGYVSNARIILQSDIPLPPPSMTALFTVLFSVFREW